MSQGKYSPALTRQMIENGDYRYNADKQIAPDYKVGDEFCPRLYSGSYDENGFDRYGYSAFDIDGNFVGEGYGVDLWGYTEDEYSYMSYEDFCDCYNRTKA